MEDKNNIQLLGTKLASNLLMRLRFLNSLFRSQEIIQKDNMVIWRIGNFSKLHRFNKVSDNPQLHGLISSEFILNSGYKFKLKIFPNGNGKSTGNYLSLYLQMGPTPDDDVDVTYPFRGVITFVVVDQSTNQQHYTTSIKASGYNKRFYKPSLKFNPEYGLQQLINQDILWNKHNNSSAPTFVVNDILVLGVSIQFCNKVN